MPLGACRPATTGSFRLLLPAVVIVVACRATVPAPPPPPVPAPTSKVEQVREGIVATPWELTFSGLRGQASSSELVGVRNGGSVPLTVGKITVEGEHAATFKLTALPELPLPLQPGAQKSVEVTFAPPANAAPGVHRAVLVFTAVGSEDGGVPVDLRGLVTKGLEGENEPPLHDVVTALSYAVDVGGRELRLGTGAEPIGEEVRAPRFRRARPGPVGIYPVARYSPDERLPYGFYVGEGVAQATPLAAIAAGQHQTLNPDLEPEGKTSFDPGDVAFGLWVKSAKHVTYSEAQHNTGPTKHAVRVYPLRTGAGQIAPASYLVCVEEAANGDYNDYVFVLVNVQPVAP
jgi:hypothetical protein